MNRIYSSPTKNTYPPKRRTVWSTKLVHEEESAWSIINKFFYINMLSIKEFKALLELEGSARLSFNLIHGNNTANSSEEVTEKIRKLVTSLTSSSNLSSRFLAKRYNKQTFSSFEEHFLKYCSECIKLGFHSNVFQLKSTVKCPIHDQELRCYCECCGQKQSVVLSPKNKLLSYHCFSCEQPFCGKKELLTYKTALFPRDWVFDFWRARQFLHRLSKLHIACTMDKCENIQNFDLEKHSSKFRDYIEYITFGGRADHTSFLKEIKTTKTSHSDLGPVFIKCWRRLIIKYRKRLQSYLNIKIDEKLISSAFEIFENIATGVIGRSSRRRMRDWEYAARCPTATNEDIYGFPVIFSNLSSKEQNTVEKETYKHLLVSVSLECLIFAHHLRNQRNRKVLLTINDCYYHFLPLMMFNWSKNENNLKVMFVLRNTNLQTLIDQLRRIAARKSVNFSDYVADFEKNRV